MSATLRVCMANSYSGGDRRPEKGLGNAATKHGTGRTWLTRLFRCGTLAERLMNATAVATLMSVPTAS
jgi:hypothetical protein